MAVGMVSDRIIFFLQVIAASFMAADYFFDEKARRPINTVIRKKARDIKKRIVADGRNLYEDTFVDNVGRTFAGLLFLASVYIILAVLKGIAPLLPWWAIVVLTLAFLFAFAVAVNSLLDKVVAAIPLFVFGVPLWMFSWFVGYCKKGSVFGVGFLFLVASFVCRYLNLP